MTEIELDLVVHMEDGSVVTAEPTTITVPPPSLLLRRGGPMLERLTDRGRRVIVHAQEEARHLNHYYIGTEHLLLGLIHEEEGVAAKTLHALGVNLDDTREGVMALLAPGAKEPPPGHIPFTTRGKKVLEYSLREALQLGHNYIGTEHLLLALIREEDGIGARVLVKKLGLDLTKVHEAVIKVLAGQAGSVSRLSAPHRDVPRTLMNALYRIALHGARPLLFPLEKIKELSDGYWRTARDRDNPGSGDDAADVAIDTDTDTVDADDADTGEDSGTGLTESVADEPIIAYKTCNLAWAPNGRWSFQGLRGDRYESVATAQCTGTRRMPPLFRESHDIPDPRCTCGFYACTEKESVVDVAGGAVLEVELYGRVIVHERGYRAEKQRVRRVELQSCHWCGHLPVTVVRLNDKMLEPLCAEHEQHLVSVAPGAVVFTPTLLTERLGVPVISS